MRKRHLISEMDQNVKRMLKLIEEDGDSFAKKAEMYYKKRPELINLVEEFYRMYRSLAERYEHVSGECRKNVPSDLQSQGSCVTDICSEPPSTCPSPPDHRFITRRRSGPTRAAGFDFFHVAISNHSESLIKDGYESSTLDSEYESDDSSVINYVHAARSDEDHGLRRRIAELELEIRNVQEKHRLLQEEIFKGSSGESRNGNFEVMSTLAQCEEELKVARKKIRSSEGDINRLKDQLLKGKDFDHFCGLQICPEEDPDRQIRCLEEKNKHIEDLNNSLDEFKLRYDTLLAEKNELDAKITTYVAELEEVSQRLYHLRVEHVEVMEGAEKARHKVEELRFRVGELEQEVKRQQEVIQEGAEEKTEAIRQLSFSLEHYRNGYHMLQKALIGHTHPADQH